MEIEVEVADELARGFIENTILLDILVPNMWLRLWLKHQSKNILEDLEHLFEKQDRSEMSHP